MLSSPCSPFDPSCEPPDPQVMEAIEQLLGAETPRSREEKIAHRLALSRALAGTRYPFDEEWWGNQAAEAVDRAWHPEATPHHMAAIERVPSRVKVLRNVGVPTLVIHGTADPAVTYSRGVATAEAIPGARLLTIEGLGHELPPGCWDEVIGAILDHTG